MKTVVVIIALNFVAFSVAACSSPQTVFSETQDNPLASLDSHEKMEKIRKLERRVLATFGLRFGREFAPSWGPRSGKLDRLHKKLAEEDWWLLAEMYLYFYISDHEHRKNYSVVKKMRLEEAMRNLLVRRGQRSIKIMNNIIEKETSEDKKKRLYGSVDYIKSFIREEKET